MKGNGKQGLGSKIGFFHTLLIFLSVKDINGLHFFHEHSYIELYSPDPNVDFGFSIAYQANQKSLVIGAPHSGLDGKVYTCPLDEAVKQKKFSCNSINIDIDKLAGNYSRHDSIDQEFCLGASISATSEYIFTCAPLWTSDFVDGTKTKFGALGTCFITNGTYASRYNGLFEQYVQQTYEERPKIDNIYGGIGWNTLYDPVNKLILISKPSLTSSISVMNSSDPLEPTKAVFLGEKLITYYFLGSFAAGVFFKNYNILYAFGMTSQSRHAGAIGFLHYDTSENVMRILQGRIKPIIIEDNSINSMYGASLHSVDVNGDGYSELLVGAPAQTNDLVMYEHGAVHFYSGGGGSSSKSDYDLCVYGVEDGSRFGTAIGSTDIDGDGLPEIFISAPYEKSGKGSVYVLSGYMITKLLQNKAIKLIKVTELSDMQRISDVPYKSFGFSMLPVTDFYENEGKLLAVGSPNDGKVALFRSIPFINVTVTALLIGKERVKEDDMNFTVTVSVNVTFPPKVNEISGQLHVSTNIIGDPAEIANNKNYTIDITTNETLYTNEILVLLHGTDPGDYKFKANVSSDVRRFDKPDYDKSFFTISNYSKSETVLDVVRRCKGKDCVPRLSIQRFETDGAGNVYMLGSRESENITVVVRNDGNVTYDSCARIRVTGVKASIVGCIQTKEDSYKCDLINIERHEERPIYIRLDMRQATNRDNVVDIVVFLYNTCAASGQEDARQDKRILFNLNTTEISIDYVSYDRNVTLTEIQDTETSPTIDVRELFTITNNGSVTWKSLPASITLEMEAYVVNNTVIIPKDGECNEVSSKSEVMFNCSVNLEPKSTFKITIIRSLFKEKIMEIFNNEKISMNSTYTLTLDPTSTTLNKTFTKMLYFQVDTSFGSNKYFIIALAVIVALFVLVVIIIILYKVGFFERKEKTKLDALKQEIKQKSIRRPNRDDAAATLQEDNQGNIEVVDDIPLQLLDFQDTRDSSSLIKNQEIKMR